MGGAARARAAATRADQLWCASRSKLCCISADWPGHRFVDLYSQTVLWKIGQNLLLDLATLLQMDSLVGRALMEILMALLRFVFGDDIEMFELLRILNLRAGKSMKLMS